MGEWNTHDALMRYFKSLIFLDDEVDDYHWNKLCTEIRLESNKLGSVLYNEFGDALVKWNRLEKERKKELELKQQELDKLMVDKFNSESSLLVEIDGLKQKIKDLERMNGNSHGNKRNILEDQISKGLAREHDLQVEIRKLKQEIETLKRDRQTNESRQDKGGFIGEDSLQAEIKELKQEVTQLKSDLDEKEQLLNLQKDTNLVLEQRLSELKGSLEQEMNNSIQRENELSFEIERLKQKLEDSGQAVYGDSVDWLQKVNILKAEIRKLNVDIDTIKTGRAINKNKLQQERLKNGVKIARKENITKEVVLELKERGLSIEEIASELKVSRATIWRRLKE